MDCIIIPEIPVRARVGVTEEERANDQEVRVSLRLHLDLSSAGASDALEDTVDYDAVTAVVTARVEERPFHLIETIAEEAARAVLSGFGVSEVEVRVVKPGALASRGVPFAAVEIRRTRGA